jgi:hypothetical protein
MAAASCLVALSSIVVRKAPNLQKFQLLFDLFEEPFFCRYWTMSSAGFEPMPGRLANLTERVFAGAAPQSNAVSKIRGEKMSPGVAISAGR